ncbi:MAG: 2-phospho-L-lactate transferase [Anaerolineales bacterium]|jgi:LPPG:FO 2-phospho-L-lactate transferase
MKIVALAGGVGGAKLVDGLAQLLSPGDLTVVVNTGDDFEHLGLSISPDLDTVCYTLAGLANPQSGWGRQAETFQILDNIQKLGGPAWFRIGDKDLATHLERTRRLQEGQSLSQITMHFCRVWGVQQLVLPMSDQPVHTMVDTVESGELPFQEYFVHRNCEPKVKGFRFVGIDSARPVPGVLKSICAADAVIICPSNPWVSIDPILALNGLRSALARKTVFAVSPIIGGQTVKGPAAKMFSELGIRPSALAVARHFGDLLSGFVLDIFDEPMAKEFTIPLKITHTLMKTRNDRRLLAQDVLNLII